MLIETYGPHACALHGVQATFGQIAAAARRHSEAAVANDEDLVLAPANINPNGSNNAHHSALDGNLLTTEDTKCPDVSGRCGWGYQTPAPVLYHVKYENSSHSAPSQATPVHLCSLTVQSQS